MKQTVGTVETLWLEHVLEHIRDEYDRMPGLCLTLSQAQRLWALDSSSCRLALRSMVEMGFLTASPFGYVRGDAEPLDRPIHMNFDRPMHGN